MNRLTTIVVLGVLAAPLGAQMVVQQGGRPPAEPGPTVYELTVRPATVGERALRYALRPTPMDQTAGDGVTAYFIATEGLADMTRTEAMQDRRDELADLLEDGVAPDERERVADIVSMFEEPMRRFRAASRYERADWNLPFREDGYETLLPPLGSYRDAARLFNARAQLRAAAGDLNGAIDDIQTQLAIARHLNGGPTLIGDLVAVALAAQAAQSVQAVMQQPETPNLYWSLAQLRAPIVPLAESMAWERQTLFFEAPLLYQATQGELTDQQWEAVAQQAAKTMQRISPMLGDGGAANVDLLGLLRMGAGYPVARQYLIEQRGMDPAVVDKMPAGRVVWSVALARFMHNSDELFKAFALPYPEAAPVLKAAERDLREHQGTVLGGWPMSQLLPALGRAYFIATQVDRQYAMLRTIEAVRLHAAEHGSLPASLDDITAVPVPGDPVTGKPFEYRADGPAFELFAPAPEGEAARYGLRYVVTVVFGEQAGPRG